MPYSDKNTSIEFNKRSSENGNLFSILIPSWNNLDYLKLCIRSIQANSTYPHQIIIHVNEGKDGTLEWVKQETNFDYTYSQKNTGVCYALNACSRLAHTEYILYMNDDMYACPGWDAALWSEIEKIGHDHFFLSATAIEPNAQSNCSIEKTYGTDIKSFDEKLLLQEYAGLPMQDWTGATWPPNIVHKKIWDMAGGYSIEFSPGMYSDPDFSRKLWQMGIRIFKGVAASRVYHFGSISVKRIIKNKGYYQFIRKWRMSSGTFSKFYLCRGKVYTGECEEVQLPFAVKLKSFWKLLSSVFVR